MITNIPTHDDFLKAGIDHLNLAWDNLQRLNGHASFAERYEQTEKEEWDNFWESSQNTLMQSISLVQQGNEFFMKGEIALVSPFLLISGEPRKWPKGDEYNNIPFSSFRTLDSTDLPKIFNTVSSALLPDDFINSFEFLRKVRNTIMHTVDKSLKFNIGDVYLAILKTFYFFNHSESWVHCRTKYLSERDPQIHLFPYLNVQIQVYLETKDAMSNLSKADIQKYYGITKARRYNCPHCHDSDFLDNNLEADLVQLIPNNSKSTNAKCFICEKEFEVVRKKCSNCNSNVIYKKDGVCLLCGENQEEPD